MSVLFASKLAWIPEGPEISRVDRIRKLVKLREELCAENRRVVQAQSLARPVLGRRAERAYGEDESVAPAGAG